MTCAQVRDRLPDHVTGRLAPERSRRIETHLESCAECHAYARALDELYALDVLVTRGAPSATTRSLGDHVWLRQERVGRETRRARWARAAAALIVTSLLAGAVWWGTRGAVAPVDEATLAGGDPSDARVTDAVLDPIADAALANAVDWSPVDWSPIVLTPPAPPPRVPETGWFTSLADAERMSAYTGKPLIEQYVHPLCPRCASVTTLLADAEFTRRLSDFVLYREVVPDALPDRLGLEDAPADVRMVFPVMRVIGAACATDPVFAIEGWADIQAVVRDFDADCARGERSALAPPVFERAAALLGEVPALVEAGRYGQALGTLREVAALAPSPDSPLVDDARMLERQLHEQLDARVSELERARVGDPVQRERAIALARSIVDGLTDTPYLTRVLSLVP